MARLDNKVAFVTGAGRCIGRGMAVRVAQVGVDVVARQMIQQGSSGKIVNTASISGKQPEPYFLHYGVSKAGVISMTKSAAVAFGPHHINVNAVCPGTTVTDMSMMAMHARAERNQVPVE